MPQQFPSASINHPSKDRKCSGLLTGHPVRQSEPRRLRVEGLEPRDLKAGASDPGLATEFVYLLNEVRTNPSTAAAWFSDFASLPAPRPPLAIQSQLRTAAAVHANSMAEHDFFSHLDPTTGLHPNQRVRDAGYPLPDHLAGNANSTEIIAAGDFAAADAALAEFFNSRTDTNQSRRRSLMGIDTVFADHSEIGVACRAATDSLFANYWVVELGHQPNRQRAVTGVVYEDLNGDGRFNAGEGIANVRISSGALTTVSDATGAYSLPVSGGTHRVRAVFPTTNEQQEQLILVRTDNVQVDFTRNATPEVNFRPRSLWTNPVQHLDVNQNSSVEPLDALVIINHLNRSGAGTLPEIPASEPPNQIDTNGDGRVTPLDALLVINYLNRSNQA